MAKHFTQGVFIKSKPTYFTVLVIFIYTKVHCFYKYFLVIVHTCNFWMENFTTFFIWTFKIKAFLFTIQWGKIIIICFKYSYISIHFNTICLINMMICHKFFSRCHWWKAMP